LLNPNSLAPRPSWPRGVRRILAVLAAVCLLADPIAARWAVASHDPLWSIGPLVAGIALLVALSAPSRVVPIGALAALTLAALAWWRPFWIIYLPPTVIDLLLAWVFSRSLVRGRTPLVEQYMRVMHTDLPPFIVRHARRLSTLWAVVMAGLGVVAAALAAAGRAEAWYTFVNVVSLAVVAALFVGEYLYRRIFFPPQFHTSPVQILRLLQRTRPWRARSGEQRPPD